MTESGVKRAFTFKPDKSGQEVYTPEDVRPFTYSVKHDTTVHIIYTPHGDTQQSEYDLPYDCKAGVLPMGQYKKE